MRKILLYIVVLTINYMMAQENKISGIMDKIQAILEMIASNGQNSGCFFV